ncbi:hypothetical protein GCM10010359_43110 [Streptomyces morookaense]|nr:hypothetical protein GCM10010359_43110 [Streptomyces morookaense]
MPVECHGQLGERDPAGGGGPARAVRGVVDDVTGRVRKGIRRRAHLGVHPVACSVADGETVEDESRLAGGGRQGLGRAADGFRCAYVRRPVRRQGGCIGSRLGAQELPGPAAEFVQLPDGSECAVREGEVRGQRALEVCPEFMGSGAPGAGGRLRR